MFNFLKKALLCGFAISLVACQPVKEEPFSFDPDKTAMKVLSCEDEDNGLSCDALSGTSMKSVFLFHTAFKRAYLEVEVYKKGEKYQKAKKYPMKVLIEHGVQGGELIKNIPPEYKLISCFCKQPECIYQSPDKSQILEWSLMGALILSVEK